MKIRPREVQYESIRILSICDDEHLAWARALIFEIAGFEVETSDSENALIECQANSFQIAVLCHSIPNTQKRKLTRELKRLFPQMQIVGITSYGEVSDRSWDLACDVGEGPASLIDSLHALSSALAPGHRAKVISGQR